MEMEALEKNNQRYKFSVLDQWLFLSHQKGFSTKWLFLEPDFLNTMKFRERGREFCKRKWSVQLFLQNDIKVFLPDSLPSEMRRQLENPKEKKLMKLWKKVK